MTEFDAVVRLWDCFIGNMNNHSLHMGALRKDQAVLGDDDGLLWHFTRFSVLKKMLAGRQIWLSELAFCMDADELCYGLRRIEEQVKFIHEGWDPNHVRTVQKLAKQAAKRFGEEHHVYAFSLSEERDTRQHWDAYGGGLHSPPDTDDPYIAIGFDAKSLAEPLELTPCYPNQIQLFSIATIDEHADRLAEYWTVTALKTLEWLEREKGDANSPLLPMKQIHDSLERMLAFTCALMKSSGWKSECECRLLLINKTFGDKDKSALPRPDGRGFYVPLTWIANRMPIQAIMVHPLGRADSVERKLRSLYGGIDIAVVPSQLKPRSKN